MTVLTQQDVADHAAVQASELPDNWEALLETAEGLVSAYIGAKTIELTTGRKERFVFEEHARNDVAIVDGPLSKLTGLSQNGTAIDFATEIAEARLYARPWAIERWEPWELAATDVSGLSHLAYGWADLQTELEIDFDSGWASGDVDHEVPTQIKRAILQLYDQLALGATGSGSVSGERIGDYSVTYATTTSATDNVGVDVQRLLEPWKRPERNWI